MRAAALLAGAWLVAATWPVPAQVPGVQRTILQRATLADASRELLLVRVEIAPGAAVGRHSHPGIETGLLVSGTATMRVDGEAPREMKAGDSYLIPAGRIHDARATGEAPVTVIATFVVERGKPLATPAP
jgi:quercetin dioxygenase-like cupin family protein